MVLCRKTLVDLRPGRVSSRQRFGLDPTSTATSATTTTTTTTTTKAALPVLATQASVTGSTPVAATTAQPTPDSSAEANVQNGPSSTTAAPLLMTARSSTVAVPDVIPVSEIPASSSGSPMTVAEPTLAPLVEGEKTNSSNEENSIGGEDRFAVTKAVAEVNTSGAQTAPDNSNSDNEFFDPTTAPSAPGTTSEPANESRNQSSEASNEETNKETSTVANEPAATTQQNNSNSPVAAARSAWLPFEENLEPM